MATVVAEPVGVGVAAVGVGEVDVCCRDGAGAGGCPAVHPAATATTSRPAASRKDALAATT
ncbi:MAG TPA: hypothetical protein VFJ97_02970 [Dermatophilaceae bacterium]|nr:hypothetical protein [Dermatophilaceae bacterium]